MQAQGFGRKGGPAGVGASFGNAMPLRPVVAAPVVEDPYAARRAAFIAQEAASGGFLDNPDRLGTMAWNTPTSGLSWNKSRTVAYLLWLFLGAVSGHYLYLGRYLAGGAQTLLGLVAFCSILISPYQISVWGSLLMLYGTWRLLDLFLIPGMCRNPPAAY